jgi:hypothetical protein
MTQFQEAQLLIGLFNFASSFVMGPLCVASPLGLINKHEKPA